MFTLKPAGKNGTGNLNGNGNGNGNWNGHKNGNGNGNGHGSKVESVLGPGIHYKGTITGAGGIRIEGCLDGAVNITGPVVIAEGAKVTADIRASAVSVAGSVKGNITAGKVEILSTGRIWGDVLTGALATEEGSFLRGEIKMEDEIETPPNLEMTQPHSVAA